MVTKANEYHKNHVQDLKKRIKELEKQLNNQMMNQFKNLTTIVEAEATTSTSTATKRNSLGPKNPLAASATIINDDALVHAQDDDNNITGADDGPGSSNNRADRSEESDDSISSSSNNNSPKSTSQRNSLEEFVNMRSYNNDGPNSKMNDSGGIQMQDMSPKPEEITEVPPLDNSSNSVAPNRNPLHSFGSVGNSFARKVNLNQFLVGDDYQAPPNYTNNAPNNNKS